MLTFYRSSARLLLSFLLLLTFACSSGEKDYDVILRGGTVYDGLGNDPVVADLAISGDTIAAIGDLREFSANNTYDVRGKAVAPGFINMLSWSTESLIEDGRGMSDILQGVTLEVMGEGFSMGPLNAAMKQELLARQGDITYEVRWSTLGEYLDYLVEKGISPNVASYVGATTVRIHEVGYDDRAPTAEELGRMQELVRVAMREGALGVGSSLIYAPASFASTEELMALVQAAADYGGAYISHIRSEGNRLEEGVQELIKIASVTGAPAEIYHLKAAGKQNWHKFDNVLQLIEGARQAGLPITADMYAYTAGATGLDASMPLWVQEGGHDRWVERLRDPQTRARVVEEMQRPTDEWENFFVQAGPENMILLEFRDAKLKPLTGQTLLEVAEARGTSPAETAIDLVIEDDSRVGTAYVLMSEDNVRKAVGKPWVSFGSDAAAVANEGLFLLSNPHPRAYGNFARVLGKYSRDESIMPLKDAIRRMTSLPASNIGIRQRGQLTVGYYADVVVFDPAAVADHSTFEDPHRYADGMDHVFVNGVHVLNWGEHTGALPGRVVRGPGWSGWPENSEADTL
ncbi:MAG TPA: D-aminoacylase [Woeseiaceae bacterium]|nr:D-aminoacylase [Woeseiaceae bacterium]